MISLVLHEYQRNGWGHHYLAVSNDWTEKKVNDVIAIANETRHSSLPDIPKIANYKFLELEMEREVKLNDHMDLFFVPLIEI